MDCQITIVTKYIIVGTEGHRRLPCPTHF